LKKCRKSFALGLFLAISIITGAFADCPGDELKVMIKGNKKTKESTIRRLADIRGECVPEEGIDAVSIKQKLLNSHLFSKVEVHIEKEPGIVTVYITVKDKWSIIPIPVLYTSEEQSGGGLLILESNLLGRKKLIVAGGGAGNVGYAIEGLYLDDAVMGSKWILVLRQLYVDRELYQYDEDDEEIYAYAEKFSLLFGILGYRVTDWLAPGIGFIYRYRDFDAVDEYTAPQDERCTNGAMLNLRIDKTDFTDYYDKGLMGTIVLQHSLKMLGARTIYGHLEATFDFTYPIWKVLTRTFIEGGWSISEDARLSNYYRLGGSVGRRGLPTDGLWVRDYISVSEQLEQVVYRHKWGTVTIAEFADCVFTDVDDNGVTYTAFPAVGAGLRAYIKELAIPAVGVDAGYGIRAGEWHISAYAGKAF